MEVKTAKRAESAAKAALAGLALACLATACDYVREREYKDERSDRHYQAAMADYSAGRMEAAAAGFEKALRSNPGNASARFQLACLLQDAKQDFMGAVCNYREYLLQEPGSDKARLAKDRCAICEKLLAGELAKKYGLGGDGAAIGELDRREREISALKAERDRSAAALKAAQAESTRLAGENARLRKMMAGIGGDDDDGPARGVSAAALASEASEDGDRLGGIPREVRELAGDDEEDDAARSALLDAPAPDGGESAAPAPGRAVGPKLTEIAAAHRSAKPDEPSHEKRPEFYVVQEGDTLYRIAVRFYGKMSAWTKIRDANKATVTTDGRIRAGQRLVLP